MDARVWGVVVDSSAKLLIPGITTTVPPTLISFAFGSILVIVMALVRVVKVPMASQIAWFYIWALRGTPLLVQLFVTFSGLPSAGITTPVLSSAVVTFSLNVGAYAAETLHGAIFAVPKGQLEAGLAANMPYVTIMCRTILPQVFHPAFPALFNSFIALIKDTSLAVNITVVEMFMTAQRIVATYYEPLVPYIEVGLIYLLFCMSFGWLQDYCEKKLNEYF